MSRLKEHILLHHFNKYVESQRVSLAQAKVSDPEDEHTREFLKKYDQLKEGETQ